MIADVQGRVNQTVELSGYADDYDKQIIGIEFSLDDGASWAYFDTSDSVVGIPVKWNYSFVPHEIGWYALRVRSVNIDGKRSPQYATVNINITQ